MFVLLMMPHVGPMIRQYNIFFYITMTIFFNQITDFGFLYITIDLPIDRNKCLCICMLVFNIYTLTNKQKNRLN